MFEEGVKSHLLWFHLGLEQFELIRSTFLNVLKADSLRDITHVFVKRLSSTRADIHLACIYTPLLLLRNLRDRRLKVLVCQGRGGLALLGMRHHDRCRSPVLRAQSAALGIFAFGKGLIEYVGCRGRLLLIVLAAALGVKSQDSRWLRRVLTRPVNGHHPAIVEFAQDLLLPLQLLLDLLRIRLHELGDLTISLLSIVVLVLQGVKDFVNQLNIDCFGFFGSKIQSLDQSRFVCILDG